MTDISPGDLVRAVSVGVPTPRPGWERDVPAAVPGHRVPAVGRSLYLVEEVVEVHGEAGLVLRGHHSVHPSRAYLAANFRRVEPFAERFAAELAEQTPMLQEEPYP